MTARILRSLILIVLFLSFGLAASVAQAVSIAPPINSLSKIVMDEGPMPSPLGNRISAPGSISASDGSYNDRIYISWNSVDGATYYELYVRTEDDPSLTNIYSGGSTDYDDTYALGGTYYYYSVKACDVSECSDYSSSDQGYIDLDPPSSVTASDGTSTSEILVEWVLYSRRSSLPVEIWSSDSDDPNSADYYDVGSGSSYSDMNADPGKYYYYWVKACGDDFCSDLSTSYDQGYMDIEAVSGVLASDGTHTDKVEITWNFMPGMDAFNIYRYTSDDPTGLDPLDLVLYETSYFDTTADPGTTYYYWVKACGPDECSSSFSTSDSGYRLALNYHLFLPLILK